MNIATVIQTGYWFFKTAIQNTAVFPAFWNVFILAPAYLSELRRSAKEEMSIPHISAVFHVVIVAQGTGTAYFRIGLATAEVLRKKEKYPDPLSLGGSLHLRCDLFVKTHCQHLVYSRKDKSPEGVKGACAQVYILLRLVPGQIIQ